MFVIGVVVLFVFLILLAIFFYGWFIEPATVEITEYPVDANARLLQRPLRILLLSDLHAGRFTSLTATRQKLKKVHQELNQQPADLMVLAGDFIDKHPRYLPVFEGMLQELAAFQLPMVAVLGNHDYSSFNSQNGGNITPLTNLLKKYGVTLLVNEATTLSLGGQKLAVIGLDDIQNVPAYMEVFDNLTKGISLGKYREVAAQVDWYRQFDNYEPDLPRLLITHNPDGVFLKGKPAAVTLAGHTHGGQMAWIDWLSRWLVRHVPHSLPPGSFVTWAGRRAVNATVLITGRGLEGSSLPLRFLRPPQAVVVSLLPVELPDNLIIGISGRARSGKDTISSMLQADFPGIRRVAIGNAIKDEYDAAHGTNTRFSEEEKIRYRAGLNELGSQRRGEDPDYWMRKVLQESPPLLITDVRLEREAEDIRQAGGLLIRVEVSEAILKARMGNHYEEQAKHLTETSLDHYPNWDYVINNDGGMDDLEKKVFSICQDIKEKRIKK